MSASLPKKRVRVWESKEFWIPVSFLLVLTLLTSGAAWWWGSRFADDPKESSLSSFESRYAVEGVRAEIYDAPPAAASTHQNVAAASQPGATPQKRRLQFIAKRIQALDEPGVRWLMTAPVFTGSEADGKNLKIISQSAQWDNNRQQGYFPVQVEAICQQPGQPVARLKTQGLYWNARERMIFTDQPVTFEFGAQNLQATGLQWNLATGQIELKSRVHLQSRPVL